LSCIKYASVWYKDLIGPSSLHQRRCYERPCSEPSSLLPPYHLPARTVKAPTVAAARGHSPASPLRGGPTRLAFRGAEPPEHHDFRVGRLASGAGSVVGSHLMVVQPELPVFNHTFAREDNRVPPLMAWQGRALATQCSASCDPCPLDGGVGDCRDISVHQRLG
jgi:hypothetical protein